MSHTDLSAEETKQLLSVLRHRQKISARSSRQFHDDYLRWCERRGKEVEASRQTVLNWLTRAREAEAEAEPGDVRKTRSGKKTTFYEFVMELSESLDPQDWPGMLTRSVHTLFPSGHADDMAILGRFVGSYELIQRQWRPAGTDDCIANVVRFERVHDTVRYSERQSFVSKYPVDARYEGYVFLNGNCAWIIAQEAGRQSFKFLTIHYFDAPLLAKSDPFYICRGNFIAVWGSNDNPSHRFILRRPTEGLPNCRIMSQGQAKSLLDKNDYNYLYP